MEIPPLRSKPAKNAGSGGGPEEAKRPRDQTPLPLKEEEDWSNLGATRVVSLRQGPETPRVQDTAIPATAPFTAGKEDPQLPDFRLLKKLGEGAMGAVYKALQISCNREVALKVLHKHVAANPKLVERLNREGEAMFRLDHPNIVQGFGRGEENGWHYIFMEYVRGQSLQKCLDQLGRLNLADALHIAIACARALHYAHQQGLIHRDIKPDNILITRKGGIKVADLGMAKHDEDMGLTQTGHAVGTPWYMPLEQARNAKEADHRCDIYALGCMLYCMITGQPPFSGRTLVDVIQAKEVGTFPPARKFNLEVPERLDLFIAKMTAKSADKRYANCGELVKDLEGLELASKQLTFLTTKPAASGSAGPAKLSSYAQTMITSKPDSDESPAPDVWYVRFPGQKAVRKLSTAQVLQLAERQDFDPDTLASHDPKEGFRALATYKEFTAAVLGKLSKSAADQKTARYRSLYKKIEEQEKKKERPVKKTDTTFTYWLEIFLKVGGVCLGVGLLLFILYYFGSNLGK